MVVDSQQTANKPIMNAKGAHIGVSMSHQGHVMMLVSFKTANSSVNMVRSVMVFGLCLLFVMV